MMQDISNLINQQDFNEFIPNNIVQVNKTNIDELIAWYLKFEDSVKQKVTETKESITTNF